VLAHGDSADGVRARALHALSFFLFSLGDFERASQVGEDSLELYRSLADSEGVGRTVHLLGQIARLVGDRTRAVELAHESLELARKLDHTRGIIVSLGHMGQLLAEDGDRAGGMRLLDEARALALEHGDETALAGLCLKAATLERSWGNRDAAIELAVQGLDLCVWRTT